MIKNNIAKNSMFNISKIKILFKKDKIKARIEYMGLVLIITRLEDKIKKKLKINKEISI